MSIEGGDGITLPKRTKCDDIKCKENRHMDPDFLELLDLYPVSRSGFNESGSTTLILTVYILDPLCNDDIKHPPMTVRYVTGFFGV